LIIPCLHSILNSLLPFYAFTPAELAKRNAEAEKVVETFTLILNKGKVELQWNDDYSRDKWWASRPRADAQINLMEPFMNMLPDFRRVRNRLRGGPCLKLMVNDL